MKTKLHMARPGDLDRLLGMVAAFHGEAGIALDGEARLAAILPLLEGSPHGVIYIIGPRNAPIGYIAISFGWSIGLGGIEGFVDELWIRPAVRGKGMGGEALSALTLALQDAGVRALHLKAPQDNPAARLCKRLGFRRHDNHCLMSASLNRA
ncbi:MAG: GNAT family N-acetyltransferase [Tropicimonas sp.]|uniref:GNAT family N-acetyltransferase n=1 Tax=Tropicimonas sp. TaxID=2067044 RepID=UPI003A89D677